MLFIVNTNSVLNSPSFPWGCHVKQWLFKSKLVIVTGHDIVMEKKEQESFTSRSLELCAWQESFSLGTSFDLDTLKRSTKTNSGYNDSRLCHNIDTCKVSTPAKTGYIICWHLSNEPDPKKVQFVRQITPGVNESWKKRYARLSGPQLK